MTTIALAPISRLLEKTRLTIKELEIKLADKSIDGSTFEIADKLYTNDDSYFNQFINQINEFINNSEDSFGHLSLAKRMFERSEIKSYEIDLSSYTEVNSISNYPENILIALGAALKEKLKISIAYDQRCDYRQYITLASKTQSKTIYAKLTQYIIERCSVDIFLQNIRLHQLTANEEYKINFGISDSVKNKRTINATISSSIIGYKTTIPKTFNLKDRNKHESLLTSLLHDLKASNYIEVSVRLTTFKNCFLNCRSISEKIYWRGEKNELGYFINQMIKNELLVKNKYKYQTIKLCFEKRDKEIGNHNFRGDRKPKSSQIIDEIIKNFACQLSANFIVN